jgi:hypothetical protein
MDRTGHFCKFLRCLSAQHTKPVTGYHGSNRGNDAIVMGWGSFRYSVRGYLECGRKGETPPGLYGDIHPAEIAGCIGGYAMASILCDGHMKPAKY